MLIIFIITPLRNVLKIVFDVKADKYPVSIKLRKMLYNRLPEYHLSQHICRSSGDWLLKLNDQSR